MFCPLTAISFNLVRNNASVLNSLSFIPLSVAALLSSRLKHCYRLCFRSFSWTMPQYSTWRFQSPRKYTHSWFEIPISTFGGSLFGILFWFDGFGATSSILWTCMCISSDFSFWSIYSRFASVFQLLPSSVSLPREQFASGQSSRWTMVKLN